MREDSYPVIPKPISNEPEEEAPKDDKKGASAPAPAETHKVEGFLVPEFYRRQAIYRSHPIFRSTLLALFLVLVVAGIGGYQWYLASNLKGTAQETQRLVVNESSRLQNQALLFKSTLEKYRELESLQKQLRIPLAPILNAIEKSIPAEISINDFAMTCPPLASIGTARRQASVRISVFFPDPVVPTDPELTTWPEKLQKTLEESSKGTLRIKRPEWGAQQTMLIPKTKRTEETKGWVRPLTFLVELDSGKLTEKPSEVKKP